MPVPVRVNHDVDEVRIVEGRRRAVVRLVGVLPGRRPGLPEIADDRVPVRLQAGPPALGVEVPLVPQAGLGRRRRRGSRRRHGVLHGIAPDGYLRAHPLRVQYGRDARGAVAPVEAGQRHLLQAEGIREVGHVLGDSRLLRHPRGLGIAEARRTVAAQVGHEHPVPGVGQRRRYPVPGPNVVGKAVQQDDRKPGRVAALLVADLQHVGLDGAQHRRGGARLCRCACAFGARRAPGHRHRAGDPRTSQELSPARIHDRSSLAADFDLAL